MSELFGLKWGDVDFAGKQVNVLRSIVNRQSARAKQKHLKSRFLSIHVWFGLFVLGVALPVSVNRQTGFSPVQSARESSHSGDRPSCDITSSRLR